MNWKAWIPLGVAIVLGLVAAKVARDMLSNKNGGGASKGVRVVIAKGRIAPGQELTTDLVALGAIAADAAPENSFKDTSEVVGRVAQSPLFTGQPILAEFLAEKGAGTGLQALVPHGLRAITINVAEDTGLAGLLAPGCMVDVVTTIRETNDSNPTARTLVKNVKVRAVGQRLVAPSSDSKDEPSRSVTLLVTPRDAEIIALATSMGQPRLILRGSTDESGGDTGVTLSELLSGGPPAPYSLGAFGSKLFANGSGSTPATATETTGGDNQRRVTVIRGTTQSDVTFQVPAKRASGWMTSTDEGTAIPASPETR